MKKLNIILFYLLTLILITSNYGYENINVEKLNNNIVISYNIESNIGNIDNFKLIANSETVKFNNIINISNYNNNNISGKLIGNIENKTVNTYKITIFLEYYLNNIKYSKVLIYKINNKEETLKIPVVENITNIDNLTKINESSTTVINNTNATIITENNVNNKSTINTNETATNNINTDDKEDSSSTNNNNNKIEEHANNNNENTNLTNDGNIILYGIIGLISGIIFAVLIIIAYVMLNDDDNEE